MKKNLFLSFHSAAVALNYAPFCQNHIHRDIVRLPVRKLLFYAVLRSKRYLEKAFLPVFSEVFIIAAAAAPHPITGFIKAYAGNIHQLGSSGKINPALLKPFENSDRIFPASAHSDPKLCNSSYSWNSRQLPVL